MISMAMPRSPTPVSHCVSWLPYNVDGEALAVPVRASKRLLRIRGPHARVERTQSMRTYFVSTVVNYQQHAVPDCLLVFIRCLHVNWPFGGSGTLGTSNIDRHDTAHLSLNMMRVQAVSSTC